jgi:hypothetical protein
MQLHKGERIFTGVHPGAANSSLRAAAGTPAARVPPDNCLTGEPVIFPPPGPLWHNSNLVWLELKNASFSRPLYSIFYALRGENSEIFRSKMIEFLKNVRQNKSPAYDRFRTTE